MIAAFRPLDPADVVLGQFDGLPRDRRGADDSTTDTYVAAKLWVDTDRWRGVPFVLRTGKRMGRRAAGDAGAADAGRSCSAHPSAPTAWSCRWRDRAS